MNRLIPEMLAALLCLVLAAGCQPPVRSSSEGPHASTAFDDLLSRYHFRLAAWPETPLAVRGFFGGAGLTGERAEDYFVVSVTAPRVNLKEFPPRYWALTLDASHGMRGRSWALARRAARMLLESLRPKDRVALATFGAERTIHAAFVPPDEALAALRTIDPSFASASDGHRRGLTHLVRGMHVLEEEQEGVSPTGFFISNFAGASESLAGHLAKLTDTGALVHVLCVAGGEDRLLPRLRKAARGRALFLSQDADFRWHLAEQVYHNFDTIARDVRASLWFGEDLRLAPVLAESPAPQALGGPGSVSVLPAVSRLGPGESRMWLFRVEGWERLVLPRLRIRVCGTLADGTRVRLSQTPQRAYISVRGPYNRGGLQNALSKALQLRLHLKGHYANRLQDGKSLSAKQVLERLRRHARQLERVNLRTSDADTARDAAASKALLDLTPERIQQLRRTASGGLNASALDIPMQNRVLPFRLLEGLLFP